MKKTILLLIIICIGKLNAQTCGAGGCTAADTNSTGRYPSAIFSTSSSSWSTVSAYMNAGNYTLFNVTSGDTYEWTYCSNVGGSQSWNAELTLFNNATGSTLCYDDNCGSSGCSTAPYIQWTASFTGIVKLLTTVSGCGTNTGSPYSTLVWRDTSGAPLIQILGVDVYSGNGTINWNSVKAAGYSFAWAKATEGVGYTDSQYLNYAVNGVSAGMKMGAYHFARPDLNPTNAGAISEANYFLSVAGPYIISCELPPSLDLEGSYLTTSFTSAQLTAWVQNWMNTVQSATGITPVLYIGATTCGYLNSSLNTYKLWTDHVTGSSTTPPTSIGVWTTWAFNQYDWTGTVPGIAGSTTDLNVFNGNLGTFNTLMGCLTTDIKQDNSTDNVIIYPNPASGSFQIEDDTINGEAIVSIYDVNGRLIFSKSISNKTVIDVMDFNQGVYTVTIKNADRVVNKKLVIVH
jgi:GH25 family lysozyme M1 (1,4-beta-N-acetylmuramidase)